jgi:Domain of unknown function (DUF4404)
MSTDRDQLRSTVDQLLDELPEVEQLDPATAERLQAALADVRRLLAETPPAAAPKPTSQPGLAQRLAAAGMHIEESHPQLASAIGNLAGMLGQMGF